MKKAVLALMLGMILSAGVAAKEPVRIDASSSESAEASWIDMLNSVSRRKQRTLIEAMLKINFAGIQSAREVAENPELQRPSISRIKDQVAGMTASEIIEYGESVATVTVER